MPLDAQVQQSPRTEDWGLRFRTCFLTGKQLWGKKAYHGVRIITGPGEPVLDHYWIDKNEFILWNLKGR